MVEYSSYIREIQNKYKDNLLLGFLKMFYNYNKDYNSIKCHIISFFPQFSQQPDINIIR